MRYSDDPRATTVPEVPMAPRGAHMHPPLGFDRPDHLSAVHGENVSILIHMVKVGTRCRERAWEEVMGRDSQAGQGALWNRAVTGLTGWAGGKNDGGLASPGAPYAAASRGSRMEKVVPLPGAESTSSWPP